MANAIFVHFLNRELLRSLNIERIEGVNYALKILLLAKDSMLYVPLSSVCENMGSTDLDYEFFDLIYETMHIELISDCATWEEFLERNLQLYYFDKMRYSCYFSEKDKYKRYKSTIIKKSGVTNSIKRALEKWEDNQKLQIRLPIKDKKIVELNKRNICEVNKNNGDKGITKSLFRGKLIKDTHELAVSRLLSVYYIKDYIKFTKGDIATGVNNDISYFDELACEYPYNDISILDAILECAGVDKSIYGQEKNKEWIWFLGKRNKPQHERICNCINGIIQKCLSCIKKKREDNIRIISNEIITYIKRKAIKCFGKIVRVSSVNQLDIMENNLKILLNCFDESGNAKSEIKNELLERKKLMNKKVFIVHGHNELLKEQVSNWLYSLELEPIVLHKQANGGTKSIIDKIERYSDVCCAIVLLTADDMGRGDKEKNYKKRARQNVIFEAGYFIGKLTSEKVILLYEDGVELPGDLGGCIYILADEKGGWKELIRTEFNEMGIVYKK